MDYDLAIYLRNEGKITTLNKPFEHSDAAEINAFFTASIVQLVRFDPYGMHASIRIFKLRLVHKIKNKTTALYKKSRLVV